MPANQLSAVCPELVESRKVANLPNPHNSIHEAVRSVDKSPEPLKMKRAMKYQNGQIHGRVPMQEHHDIWRMSVC